MAARPFEVGKPVRNSPVPVTPSRTWLKTQRGKPFSGVRAASASTPKWIDGLISYQSGTNCSILGSPYPEQMVGAFTGYWGTEDISYPKIGDRYWGHIYMTVVGNTCPYGIADVATEIALPPGTSLAVNPSSSDPNDKIRCYGTNTSGTTTEITDTFWQAPWDTSIRGKYCDSTAVSNGPNGLYIGQRLLAQGQSFHIVFPLRSTKELKGIATTTDKMTATLTSGVNTTARPSQWVWVGDRPVAFEFPTDAVTGISDNSAHTKGLLYNWFRTGKVYVELGEGATGTTYPYVAGPYDIDGANAGYAVDQDWSGLNSGTDYRWRLRFVDTKGNTNPGDDVTHLGPPSTFRTTGTPGSGGTPTAGGGGAGSNTGGTSGGTGQQGTNNQGTGDQGTTTESDTASPGVTLRLTGAKLRQVLKKGLAARFDCDEACSVQAQLQVSGKLAKRLKLGRKNVVIGRGQAAITAPGSGRVVMKLTSKARKRLRRVRTLKATVVIVARDNAGNVSAPVRRGVTLKR